jgi:DNA-binding phage protein
MKEYNNITLRDSQETIKEFLLQILNENNKNENIYSNIMNIKKNYENFINDFKNKSFSQNDFAKYLFNQLIIIKQ